MPREPAAPLALTLGDPAGIGPEIVVRACADPARTAPVVVIGDLQHVSRPGGGARTARRVRRAPGTSN
ncbi:hypothetical protein [Streptomyces sp. KL116D]|uniref:hypothetical protein n=1 Tax=Streptomyces sp. KL116D TaxID=3045152 RepID=UPI00355778EF